MEEENNFDKVVEEKINPISLKSAFYVVLGIHLVAIFGIAYFGSMKKSNADDKKLLDDSGQSSITAKYITMVRNIIEKKKFYPFVARKRELEGSVTIKMTIKSTGEIIGASIIKASVHKILNEAALATVHKVEKFPSFPSSIKKSFIDITIPLVYKLI